MTPLKAIKAKCLDCCCYQPKEVKMCGCPDCPLYEFRLGKNPNRKRALSEQDRQAIADRLKSARNK